jgi:hypothetical protein|tara:strand:- start:8962 stop:9723 length:762 start_codon:yes stop_codon:yes gene_type:complete
MPLLDKEFTKSRLTNNQLNKKKADGTDYVDLQSTPYRWTHGATDFHLGDGLLVYTIIQVMRFKTCVCLGSGGGFIPRIMTQARLDLHDQEIFEGSADYNWGDIGVTYLVDAANGIGGNIDYLDEDSFFRYLFAPRFIKDTTENAYYNFFVKQDIKIDLLHIDAGHSYEDVKKDFELYSKLINPNGIITIHDTDENFQKELIVSEDEKKYFNSFDGPSKFIKEIGPEWKQFNFFNVGNHPSKPSSTGLTLIQRA